MRLLESPLAVEGSALSEMRGGLPRARRLRRVVDVLLFAAPLGLTLLEPLIRGWTAAAVAAVSAAGAGALLEHWLFLPRLAPDQQRMDGGR